MKKWFLILLFLNFIFLVCCNTKKDNLLKNTDYEPKEDINDVSDVNSANTSELLHSDTELDLYYGLSSYINGITENVDGKLVGLQGKLDSITFVKPGNEISYNDLCSKKLLDDPFYSDNYVINKNYACYSIEEFKEYSLDELKDFVEEKQVFLFLVYNYSNLVNICTNDKYNFSLKYYVPLYLTSDGLLYSANLRNQIYDYSNKTEYEKYGTLFFLPKRYISRFEKLDTVHLGMQKFGNIDLYQYNNELVVLEKETVTNTAKNESYSELLYSMSYLSIYPIYDLISKYIISNMYQEINDDIKTDYCMIKLKDIVQVSKELEIKACAYNKASDEDALNVLLNVNQINIVSNINGFDDINGESLYNVKFINKYYLINTAKHDNYEYNEWFIFDDLDSMDLCLINDAFVVYDCIIDKNLSTNTDCCIKTKLYAKVSGYISNNITYPIQLMSKSIAGGKVIYDFDGCIISLSNNLLDCNQLKTNSVIKKIIYTKDNNGESYAYLAVGNNENSTDRNRYGKHYKDIVPNLTSTDMIVYASSYNIYTHEERFYNFMCQYNKIEINLLISILKK